MNTTTNTLVARLQISQRWLWVGPVAGIAAMIALFVWGATSGHPQVMVISSGVAAALGAIWAGVATSTKAAIAKEMSR